MILSIGHSSVLDFVFSVTLLTRRSRWFVSTPVMRASGHKPLGDFSSVSSTMSPIWKFRRGLNHFCLCCKVGRYSFTHLHQNTSDKYWTCLHLSLEYMSSLANIPGGNGWLYRKRRRWLGVRGSRSRTSSETFVKALLFTIDSASHMNVDSPSSSSTCSLTSAFKTFLTVLMQRSHGPPWWDPHGGLNVHWTFLWSRKSAIFFLVPFFDRVVKFAFSWFKIAAVVGSYQFRRSPSCNKSPETL